ncbi:hypothetical protein [Stygiolobus caldivivus]|uniref:Uncharacterized protein n=1 Tax=Stygiolobus caldivivus TaxID=2824673 RepID=A0A8D5U6N8_9CREN|nr:hypothetical protein [Stygiolobus caldivivus]BCU70055.1 hypothetical protein KN1_13520 [Stygiolobus caldivivus]
MQAVREPDISQLLREYTEDLPKKINSPDEEKYLLLVKPLNFESTILFSPGVSIFKAIYGRGKTYGIGYYTVHYCERTKECSAIYINVRRMHNIVSREVNSGSKIHEDILSLIKRSSTIRLDLELLYTILLAIDSRYKDIFEVGDVLLTTDISHLDPQIISEIKSEIMQIEDSEKLSRLFEVLVEKLILKSHISPKLILILDEFEQLVPTQLNQLQIVNNLLISLLTSLRSSKGGVLERYPNTFTLVLTIQELAYPSEAMREFRRSAAPIIGKIISSADDLSIPIKFSPYTSDSIKEYYEKALELLAYKGFITDDEKLKLENISKCLSYYLSNLLKMPARLFFERLRAVITDIVTTQKDQILKTMGETTDGKICDRLENFFEDIRSKIAESGIYGLYISKEISGINKDKIFSMLRKLAEELDKNTSEEKFISEVKANGYEGIVVLYPGTDKGATIILYKGRSVKLGETKYRQGFIKHYGDILANNCGFAKGKKDNDCKILIVHPEEANIIGMFKIIYELQQISNIRISKKVIDVPLDRDEFASLYIKSASSDSTDQFSLISGDINYYEQRFKEVIERIKRQIEKEVVAQK